MAARIRIRRLVTNSNCDSRSGSASAASSASNEANRLAKVRADWDQEAEHTKLSYAWRHQEMWKGGR